MLDLGDWLGAEACMSLVTAGWSQTAAAAKGSAVQNSKSPSKQHQG